MAGSPPQGMGPEDLVKVVPGWSCELLVTVREGVKAPKLRST